MENIFQYFDMRKFILSPSSKEDQGQWPIDSSMQELPGGHRADAVFVHTPGSLD
jgi:hypothetical protein